MKFYQLIANDKMHLLELIMIYRNKGVCAEKKKPKNMQKLFYNHFKNLKNNSIKPLNSSKYISYIQTLNGANALVNF